MVQSVTEQEAGRKVNVKARIKVGNFNCSFHPTRQSRILTILRTKAFEKIVGKGENAG